MAKEKLAEAHNFLNANPCKVFEFYAQRLFVECFTFYTYLKIIQEILSAKRLFKQKLINFVL